MPKCKKVCASWGLESSAGSFFGVPPPSRRSCRSPWEEGPPPSDQMGECLETRPLRGGDVIGIRIGLLKGDEDDDPLEGEVTGEGRFVRGLPALLSADGPKRMVGGTTLFLATGPLLLPAAVAPAFTFLRAFVALGT
jgi:hypothetical protein